MLARLLGSFLLLISLAGGATAQSSNILGSGIFDAGKAAAVGPPVFTPQAAASGGSSGGSPSPTTTTVTLPSGSIVVALAVNNVTQTAQYPITVPTISTGGTCNVYASDGNTAGALSFFIVCVTSSAGGSATITYDYANNPFAGSPGYYWTAPSSGFSSTIPTVGSNHAAGNTVLTASSISTSSGGTCLVTAVDDANIGGNVVVNTGTLGPSMQVTARSGGTANLVNYFVNDTIGNTLGTSSTQTITETWPSSGNLSTSMVCFR